MKDCSKCSIPKQLEEFSKNPRGKFGRNSVCRTCFSLFYYKPNKDLYAERRMKWKEQNTEHLRELDRKYFQNPQRKKKHKANQAYRRALILNSTLPGLENLIKEIYIGCPSGMQVDHIVPLRGKMVCGLHVPWNLQYLPAVDNLKKSNKF